MFKIKTIISACLFFLIGFFTHYFYQTFFESEDKMILKLTPHSIIDETNDDTNESGGVQVFVLSNPTCDSCDEIYQNICSNLSDTNTSYKAILYPENNIDIWLSALIELSDEKDSNSKLDNNNKKLQLFQWLKKNRALWEDMTNINDFIHFLYKHKKYDLAKAQKIISNPQIYWSHYSYTKALTEVFNVQGIPTVAICLILGGSEFKWSDIAPIVAEMKHIYQKLKQEHKVL